ncbi:MAG: spore cortex biosynthesis protein YabQ [Clostridia bacterium]|nr:spore cortex biosynthesis protein YabQ [Clostridia bacterium]
MEGLNAQDTALLLDSILLGFCFGLYYEVFRFIRLAVPHCRWIVFLEDLFFFLPITLIFILFTFAFSDGTLRWFSFFGVWAGFFLYLGTLGKILFYFAERILALIRRFLLFLYRITLKPVFFVIKKVTITLFTKYKKQVIIKKQKALRARLIKQKITLIRQAEKGFC